MGRRPRGTAAGPAITEPVKGTAHANRDDLQQRELRVLPPGGAPAGRARTFPQIVVDDEPIGGHDELRRLVASGELDAAGTLERAA